MDSKYVMELVDRLLAANDKVSEYSHKFEALEYLAHKAQDEEAENRVKWWDKKDWNFDNANVSASDVLRILGLWDSSKARQIIDNAKENDNAGE